MRVSMRGGFVAFAMGCGVFVTPSVAPSLKGRPQTHRPSGQQRGQHYWKLTTDVVSLRLTTEMVSLRPRL